MTYRLEDDWTYTVYPSTLTTKMEAFMKREGLEYELLGLMEMPEWLGDACDYRGRTLHRRIHCIKSKVRCEDLRAIYEDLTKILDGRTECRRA